MSTNKCQALIEQGPNKGKQCSHSCDDKYCVKHIRNKLREDALKSNISYCDIARGCFEVLSDGQKSCSKCLEKERMRDRKRHQDKRNDLTKCIECSTTLDKDNIVCGKRNTQLRRCKACYDKLLEVEQSRTERNRNYKAEGFKNKDIIWNNYIKNAKKRSIIFELEKELFNNLLDGECVYCHYKKDGEVNGIDRVDNNIGYVEKNVVSCCENCNKMKGSYNVFEYLDKINAMNEYIYSSNPISDETIKKWHTTYLSKTSASYSKYKSSAAKRGLVFELSEAQYTAIKNSQCYLCGIKATDTHKNGIDRFDNSIGYTLDNSRPCCGHCNIIKKDLTYDTLKNKVKLISNNYEKILKQFEALKVEKRTKINEIRPKVADLPDTSHLIAEREYKPVNVVAVPENIKIPEHIQTLLTPSPPPTSTPKQWKAKQIHEHFKSGNLESYKSWCEETNQLSGPEWQAKWGSFVSALKCAADTTPIIKQFVVDLRKLRHDKLVEARNHEVNPLERENRQQWPAISVVRAYHEGKLDLFKKFQEKYTGDAEDSPQWQKRWQGFTESLDNSSNDDDKKKLVSKFMTAQRTRVYRASKS